MINSIKKQFSKVSLRDLKCANKRHDEAKEVC